MIFSQISHHIHHKAQIHGMSPRSPRDIPSIWSPVLQVWRSRQTSTTVSTWRLNRWMESWFRPLSKDKWVLRLTAKKPPNFWPANLDGTNRCLEGQIHDWVDLSQSRFVRKIGLLWYSISILTGKIWGWVLQYDKPLHCRLPRCHHGHTFI